MGGIERRVGRGPDGDERIRTRTKAWIGLDLERTIGEPEAACLVRLDRHGAAASQSGDGRGVFMPGIAAVAEGIDGVFEPGPPRPARCIEPVSNALRLLIP